MNKKTRSLVVVFALASGSLVTLATSPASPVKAASTVSTAIYKITAVESESTPIGCTGCSPMRTNVPTYTVQDTIGNTVATASEIDTFNTSAWDQIAQTQITIQGGCAIVLGGLKCWGKNMNGQLGNETTTNSESLPVIATENGTPITGITDVSTNGLTTCVVANGRLKCVGAGNLPGIYSQHMNTWGNIETVTNGTWSNENLSGTLRFQVFNSNDEVLYDTGQVAHNAGVPQSMASKKWTTFAGAGSDVAKVQVGNSNNGSTPDICVLKTTGLAACAVVSAATTALIPEVTTITHNCSNGGGSYSNLNPTFDDTYETTTECGGQNYRQKKNIRVSGTQNNSRTWSWADAEMTGAVDIAMPSDTWGAASVCFAGVTTICRTFQAGVFGAKKTIENGENSQSVYMTSGFGPPGLCLYSNNTISCGAGSYGVNGIQTTATKVTAVAVMARPLNIFFGTSQSMQKLYFLLPTGLLAADSWIFSCSGCQSQSTSVVAPVTAFSTSTASEYTYAQSINGSTDSADYIPMTIVSGDRKSRSSVAITVKTASGENLTGVSVRWTAPDAPGLLSSSSSSTLATDVTGSARTTVTSGPVTFTLSVPIVSVCPPTCTNGPTTTSTTSTTIAGAAPAAPAGTLTSGVSLQAASITVVVGDTGTIAITVPDPPAVVSRKISVTLPDGTPVPNATVQLKNNYLTYAYTNSGNSTSTWSSRPKDTKGYLGQMNCAYCFVAPPKYATGVDGSVTFSSFNPSSRSSAYDADIAYDDGELNQNVKKTFTSTTETVQMPFMAAIKVTLPDADPATPAKETDADPSTPETDIKPDSNGSVTVQTELVDEDKAPISGVSQSVETVNSGSSCEQGGLVSSTDKVASICANGGVSASSINKAAIVRAMSVKTSAGCSSVMNSTTGSTGKATLVICPTASTKYRIRGTGAIATKTICVRVNNAPCAVSSTSVNTKNTVSYAPTVVVSKIAVMKKGKILTFTSINKVAKVKISSGAKIVLVVAVTSKKYCSISGTKVKALKAGTCAISVKVTPKATAKVKKPKTTTTKIKVKVT